MHEKTRFTPRFQFVKYVETAVKGPSFKRLFAKSPLKIRKKLPQNTFIYFGKAFKVPRNFSRKVSCIGVFGRRPN